MWQRFALCAFAMAMLLGLVGCASKVPPEFLDPAYSTRSFERIYVMPAVDARTQTNKSEVRMDVEGIQNTAAEKLKDMGYAPVTGAMAPGVDAATLAAMPPEQLVKFAPEGESAVVFIFVTDSLDANYGITSEFRVTGKALLIDRTDGHLYWRQSGFGRYSEGGVIAVGIAQAFETPRAKEAFARFIVSTLPERKQK